MSVRLLKQRCNYMFKENHGLCVFFVQNCVNLIGSVAALAHSLRLLIQDEGNYLHVCDFEICVINARYSVKYVFQVNISNSSHNSTFFPGQV